MPEDRQRANFDERVAGSRYAGQATLQFCFIAVLGLVVAAAFITALGYEFVSARTPIVIMVPLLVLIGAQFVRSLRAMQKVNAGSVLSAAVKGRNPSVNRTAGFIGWMTFFLALIVAVGHYAAIALVMFALLRIVCKERLELSLALTLGMTAAIFLVFELGFDIELHRGAIFRILSSDIGFERGWPE